MAAKFLGKPKPVGRFFGDGSLPAVQGEIAAEGRGRKIERGIRGTEVVLEIRVTAKELDSLKPLGFNYLGDRDEQGDEKQEGFLHISSFVFPVRSSI